MNPPGSHGAIQAKIVIGISIPPRIVAIAIANGISNERKAKIEQPMPIVETRMNDKKGVDASMTRIPTTPSASQPDTDLRNSRTVRSSL